MLKLKLQSECHHEQLQFASGDYYVFCRDCMAQWVMRNPRKSPDVAAPECANKGVGMGLSGEIRVRFTVKRP